MKPEDRLAEARKQLQIVEDELDNDPQDFQLWAHVSNARLATEEARQQLEAERCQ